VDVPGLSLRTRSVLADGTEGRDCAAASPRERRGWNEARRGNTTYLSGIAPRDGETEVLRFAGLAADRVVRGIGAIASNADAL
jgi:hypothetical protein